MEFSARKNAEDQHIEGTLDEPRFLCHSVSTIDGLGLLSSELFRPSK
jgi:hypothetical protein